MMYMMPKIVDNVADYFGKITDVKYFPEENATRVWTLNEKTNAKRVLKIPGDQRKFYPVLKRLAKDLEGNLRVIDSLEAVLPTVPIAVVKHQSYTSEFKIEVIPQFEHMIPELSFVKVFTRDLYGRTQPFIGQIVSLERNAHKGQFQSKGDVFGRVVLLGRNPRLTFEMNSNVYLAQEEDIQHALDLDPTGYWLGRLQGTNIDIKVRSSKGENNAFSRGVSLFGSVGCGKCLDKNTLVSCLTDGCFCLDSIEKIYEKERVKFGEKQVDGGFIIDLNDFFVPSFDGEKMINARATRIFKKLEPKLIEITTKRGRRIAATAEHKLLVLNESGLVWKNMSELSIGDGIAYPKQVSNGISFNELTVDDAYFLGLYIAEGSPGRTKGAGGRITNSEMTIVNWLTEYIRRRFEFSPTVWIKHPVKSHHVPCFDINLRKSVNPVLFGTNRCKSGTKFIPLQIFNSSDEIKKSFLAGYVEGDGYLHYPVEMTTKSDRLASDLVYLLSHFGLTASIKIRRISNTPYYRVMISAKDIDFFRTLPYKFKQFPSNKFNTYSQNGCPKQVMILIKKIYGETVGGCRGRRRKFGRRQLKGKEKELYAWLIGKEAFKSNKKVFTHDAMNQVIVYLEKQLVLLNQHLEKARNLDTLSRVEQASFFSELTFPFITVMRDNGVPQSKSPDYLKNGVPEAHNFVVKAILCSTLQSKIIKLEEGLRQLIRINSLNWDFVTEKTEKEYGDFVYDFFVPETHNFVGGNMPTIMHNSATLRVTAEEVATNKVNPLPVIFVDLNGEYVFKFKNSSDLFVDSNDKKQLEDAFKEFKVTPSVIPNIFVSFNREKNPLSDVIIEDERIDVLASERFYQSILKPGVISTISLKGLDRVKQDWAVAFICNKIRDLQMKGSNSQAMLAFDETHEFAEEGFGKSYGKTELVELAKTQGHAGIFVAIATQRKADVKKSLTAPMGGWFVFGMSDPNDLNQLSNAFKPFKHVIETLPRATCLSKGVSNSMLVLSVRPPKTLHFRLASSVKEYSEKYPQPINEELNAWLNDIRVDTKDIERVIKSDTDLKKFQDANGNGQRAEK
jgi:intein/homing endonuclease